MHPFMASEFDYVPLANDQKRNGIFLAEMVALLVPDHPTAAMLSNQNNCVII